MPIINTGCPVLQRYGKSFLLKEDFIYIDRDGSTWLVPAGFETDLASIPNWIWWWQWGCWNYAAILHDFGYCNHGFIRLDDGKPVKIPVSRFYCDRKFYEALLDLQVSPIESKLMYWAVHLFGRFLW